MSQLLVNFALAAAIIVLAAGLRAAVRDIGSLDARVKELAERVRILERGRDQ
jgi:hypothetical protein